MEAAVESRAVARRIFVQSAEIADVHLDRDASSRAPLRKHVARARGMVRRGIMTNRCPPAPPGFNARHVAPTRRRRRARSDDAGAARSRADHAQIPRLSRPHEPPLHWRDPFNTLFWTTSFHHGRLNQSTPSLKTIRLTIAECWVAAEAGIAPCSSIRMTLALPGGSSLERNGRSTWAMCRVRLCTPSRAMNSDRTWRASHRYLGCLATRQTMARDCIKSFATGRCKFTPTTTTCIQTLSVLSIYSSTSTTNGRANGEAS